jgi:serine/threonine protein kinase
MNIKKAELSVNNFTIGRKLGKGRFGSVYMAQDKATRFLVAMKVINVKQLRAANMQNQLVEEIKLQMFCKHPNLLKMYGCFRDETNIYLLLELGIECLFRTLRTKVYPLIF